MASEKRLIDANALIDSKWWESLTDDFDKARARIIVMSAPTVDAVEVVRCKDCKHWLKDVPGCTDFIGHCEWGNYMIGAAGYCVYGERKDNERKAD